MHSQPTSPRKRLCVPVRWTPYGVQSLRCMPRYAPSIRRPPFLHGLLAGPSFPASQVLRRRSDSCPPITPHSLRCAVLPWVCLNFAPAIRDTRPRAWRWVHGDLPAPTCPRRPTGLSGSWGTPVCARHGLRPRQDRKRQAQFGVPTRPPLWQRRGLLRTRSFRGSIHGQHTRCLRFAAGVAAVHARLASGCGPTLPDGIGYPSGSTERFQGHFQCIPSSFPKLTDAMPPDPLPGTPQRAFPTGFGHGWLLEEERSVAKTEPGRVGPEGRGDTPRL